MYSMPNGVQEQDVEEGASGGESGEWHSDAEEDEESDDSSDDEEVDEDTVENWLKSITGNKDNPRGSRSVPPFDNSRQPDKVQL